MISEPEQRRTEFQLATPEDALAMVNFRNSYYSNRMRRKPEHWLWEYQTYEPGKTVFAYAKEGDKLVGTQAMLPIYIEVGSGSVLSGKSEDTLILPPYRGTGIMKNLYEYAVEKCIGHGMQLLWSLTTAPKAYQNFGFTCYPDIQVLIRPGNIWLDLMSRLQTQAPLWRRLGSMGKLVLRFILMRNKKGMPQIEKKPGYEIEKGRTREEDLEELYQRMRSEYSNAICIKYDHEYLTWRLREHPFLKYDEYQVYQDGKLRAYAFVILSHVTASISDLLSEDSYATSLLLSEILKNYSKKAGQFRFMGNPRDFMAEDIFEQLHRFGFSIDEKTSKSWNLGIKDLTGGYNDKFFDIRNWHVNSLWTEGYLY